MTLRSLSSLAAGFVLALSALVGSASAADRPDTWITLKTKLALMTTNDLSTSGLNVDTVNGIVTLHGKVPTEAEKTAAEKVSMHVDGVKAVKNLLQVVPDSKRDIVNRTDADVKNSVEAAFKANRRVSDSGVKVASVNQGVVLLSGKVKSLAAHVEAIEVAYAVKGVRRVSSEVEVTEPTT